MGLLPLLTRAQEVILANGWTAEAAVLIDRFPLAHRDNGVDYVAEELRAESIDQGDCESTKEDLTAEKVEKRPGRRYEPSNKLQNCRKTWRLKQLAKGKQPHFDKRAFRRAKWRLSPDRVEVAARPVH